MLHKEKIHVETARSPRPSYELLLGNYLLGSTSLSRNGSGITTSSVAVSLLYPYQDEQFISSRVS